MKENEKEANRMEEHDGKGSKMKRNQSRVDKGQET